MDDELRRLAGWHRAWAPGELSLAEAWRQCPDGRWMAASLVHGGVERRHIVAGLAACIRALLPEDAEPAWRPVLEAAERYGRGEGSPEDLAAAVPGPPRKGQPAPAEPRTGHLVASLRGIEPALPERLAGLAGIVTVQLLRALHPATPYPELASVAAQAVELLAIHRGLRARRESHDASGTMLDEHAESAGHSAAVLTARATLPPAGSDAWDESAARAFEQAMRTCAERFRAAVESPF